MEIFRKQGSCEVCKCQFPKKQLCLYDMTRQGRIKGEHKLLLCQKCAHEKFFNDINQKAVLIYPLANHNSYAYYSFTEIIKASDKTSIHKEKDLEFINIIKKLLPPEDSKCSCGEGALFTWCSPEVFDSDPYNWESNTESLFDYIYLCKKCLYKEFVRIKELEEISFRTIFPPTNDQGYCTPWDV